MRNEIINVSFADSNSRTAEFARPQVDEVRISP